MPTATLPAGRLTQASIVLGLTLLVMGCKGGLPKKKMDVLQPGRQEMTAEAGEPELHGQPDEPGERETSGRRVPKITVSISNGGRYYSFSDGEPVSFTIDHCSPVHLSITTNPRRQIRSLVIAAGGRRTTQLPGEPEVTQQVSYPAEVLERLSPEPPLEFSRTYDFAPQSAAGPTGDFVSYSMTWDITAENFVGLRAGARVVGSFAHGSFDPVFVPGVGQKADGAGAAVGDINGDGTADLVLLAYDAPSDGSNSFRYRVAWDLKSDGRPSGVSDWVSVAGVGANGDGAGVDLADLNGNGTLDMVVMAYDNPDGVNSFRYRVGLDLNAQGRTGDWGEWKQVTGVGNRADGAGLAIADLDGNGKPEMVLMAYDGISGIPNSFRYWVGHDLDATGAAASWTGWHQIGGVGNSADGAGCAFADLDGNGKPELVFLAYDDPADANSFRYRVGWNVGASGTSSSWSTWKQVDGLGNTASGAGLTITELPGSFMPQMLFMAYDLGSQFRYRIESRIACDQE
jgi:hypothetical protein